MQLSKLTKKYQTTIPSDIRKFLHLGKGDVVEFRIKHKKVVLEKASAIDRQFARFTQGTLSEWNSRQDDEAFKDL